MVFVCLYVWCGVTDWLIDCCAAGNILLNCHGVIKLADFGITTVVENTSKMANTFIGTMSYMAPERIAGHSLRQADRQTGRQAHRQLTCQIVLLGGINISVTVS